MQIKLSCDQSIACALRPHRIFKYKNRSLQSYATPVAAQCRQGTSIQPPCHIDALFEQQPAQNKLYKSADKGSWSLFGTILMNSLSHWCGWCMQYSYKLY